MRLLPAFLPSPVTFYACDRFQVGTPPWPLEEVGRDIYIYMGVAKDCHSGFLHHTIGDSSSEERFNLLD